MPAQWKNKNKFNDYNPPEENDEEEEEEIVIQLRPDTHPEIFVPLPPDGGWGWVVVFASFMMNCILDGIVYAFGVLMPDFQNHFGASKASVSLIGSLLCGCLLCIGPIAGALINKFGCRKVSFTGAIIACTGFFLSAFSPNIAFLTVTYGVIGGIGLGLAFMPSIVIVSFYFDKKRAIATGIAVGGSGMGAIIFAPINQALLSYYHWTNVMIILAGITLNCAVFGSLFRPLKPCLKLAEQETKPSILDKIKSKFSKKKIEENGRSRQPSMSESMGSFYVKSQQTINIDGMSETTLRQYVNRHAAQHRASIGGNELRSCMQLAPLMEENMGDRAEANDTVPPLKSQISQDSTVGPPISPSAAQAAELMAKQQVMEEQEKKKVEVEPKPRSRFLSCNDMATSVLPSSKASRGIYSTSALDTAQMAPNPDWIPLQITTENKGVEIKDFARPLYRQDIFYSGSVMKLNQRIVSNSGVPGSSHIPNLGASHLSSLLIASPPAPNEETTWRGSYFLSMTRIPGCVFDDTDEGGGEREEKESCLHKILPKALADILIIMTDFSLLKNPRFFWVWMANAIAMIGFYIPNFYLVDYSRSLGVSDANSTYLLSIMGITNTIGRFLFGWLASHPKVHKLYLNNITVLIAGLSTMLLPFCTTYISQVIYAAVYGLFNSCWITLTSVILCDLVGLEALTTAFGLIVLARGFTGSVGAPLGGILFDMTKGYDIPFYLAGFSLILCSVCHFMILLPCFNKPEQLDSSRRHSRVDSSSRRHSRVDDKEQSV